jgi:hypothetical protein
MRYRDRNTGVITFTDDIRNKFFNTSFPLEPWNKDIFDFIEADPITEVDRPRDKNNEVAADGGVTLIDGEWTQVWNMVPRYTEEELADIKKKEEEGYWIAVREERNKRLAAADITINRHRDLRDMGVKPFQQFGCLDDALYLQALQYKQYLRTITDNLEVNKPVNWPIDPMTMYEAKKQQFIAEVVPFDIIKSLNKK